MRRLPEPEAVIIAIVDAEPSVQRGLACLAESKQIDEGPLSAWEVVPVQAVDATPSNALIRECFPGRTHLCGRTRSKASQGSVLLT